MLAILTKYAFEVLEVDEMNVDELRDICDPTYTGPVVPSDVLYGCFDGMDELCELVLVDDDGKVIYDGDGSSV